MRRRRRNSSAGRTLLIVFICLAIIAIWALISGYLIFRHFYKKTSIETEPTVTSEAPSSTEYAEVIHTTEPPETVASSAEESIEAEIRGMSSAAEETEPVDTKHIYQILLIGVDRRDTSWNGNSDAMILATVNYDSQTVTLTSFMRDLGVSVPGYGVRKMNFAFAIGGAPVLLDTMALNFGITPNNYAWVDFEGMKAIIDSLGGVELTLTPAEADFIGISIEETQSVYLTGEQALKHTRDRSSGGNDYSRTQRQRNVILAIVNKMRLSGLGELTDAANTVLPYIHHNIDQATLLGLIFDLTSIKDYTFLQQRVPFDGLYHGESEMLIPDFSATNALLRESLY